MKTITHDRKGNALIVDSEGDNYEQLLFGVGAIVQFVSSIKQTFRCKKAHKNLFPMTKKQLKGVEWLPGKSYNKNIKYGQCPHCAVVFELE